MSNEQYYSKFLELAPVGCLLLADGVITHANALAISTMQIPEEKMVGVALGELLVPEYEEAWNDLLTRLDGGVEQESVRLAKGLEPLELNVRRLDASVSLVSVRSMANEHYYSAQAGGALTHDTVTGFPNHYHVLSELSRRLKNNRKPLALICIWVDELPQVAKDRGKRAVQRLVREVGERLQLRLRAPDVVGRFEHTGFLVMMNSDAEPEQLAEIAERLRDEIAFPVELDQMLVSFTASLVVASVDTAEPSIERVLALLEAAGNRAAQSGGNRTEVLSL